MANKIKYGLKNVYYAICTIDPSDNSATYDEPVAFPGAVSLSLDAEGDTNIFYADNIAYYVTEVNNGYTGTLEMARITEDFAADVLGEITDAAGLSYETADGNDTHFALLFQFEGDDKATRHVIYNCVASRPSVAGSTKEESIEPQTETINITATSIYDDTVKKDIVKARALEGTTAYTDFFEAVQTPA